MTSASSENVPERAQGQMRPVQHHDACTSRVASCRTREFFDLLQEDAAAATSRLRCDTSVADALVADYGLPTDDGAPSLSFGAAEVLSFGAQTAVIKAHTSGWGLLVVSRPVVLKLGIPDANGRVSGREELRREHRLRQTTTLARGQDYEYLVSELAEGTPVLTWLERRGWLTSEPSDSPPTVDYEARIDVAAALGRAICSALAEIQSQAGASHGNLAFSSVLVSGLADNLAVALIDAGAEYRDADRTEPTDAPEPFPDQETRPELSDAYALGVILLQVLTPKRLRVGQLQDPLAQAWTTCPELARIVEDLIDPNPGQRLSMLPIDGDTDRWTAISNWIDGEQRLSKIFRPPSDILEGGTSEASISSWGQVRRYFAAANEVKLTPSISWPGYDLLKYLNLVSYVLWVLCLTGVIVLTSADIGLSAPDGDAAKVIKKIGDFKLRDFGGNFPGRLLALSFSYAALTFYSRILASVTARGLGVPLIEASMRVVPLIFQLPAVWVIFYDPRAWPIAATLGILATVVINGFIQTLDRRAMKAMSDSLGYDDRHIRGARKQSEPHRAWAQTAGTYLTLLIAFDFLLYRYPVLHDDWFYAICLAIGANYYILYVNSIRKLGSSVHGSLQRSTFILRRAASISANLPLQSNTSAQANNLYPDIVVPLVPLAVVMSVAIATSRGRGHGVEFALGASAATALALGGVVATLIRSTHLGRWSQGLRAIGTTASAVGLWLAVSVAGRFLFDASWARVVAALLGAAGSGALAYWILQSPDSPPSPDSGEGVPSARLLYAQSAPEADWRTQPDRTELVVALLNGGHGDLTSGELEQKIERAWTQSPWLGRAVERLSGLSEALALDDTQEAAIEAARVDAQQRVSQTVWEWRRLGPLVRARCSLPNPGGSFSTRQAAGIITSSVMSWTIAGLCSLGFVYFCIVDLDWQRTPERFLALTYCIGAIAFQQILIGWCSVLHVSWLSRRQRVSGEVLLRLVPLVFQGPAIGAIFVAPDLWPLWATIGIGSTAVVNGFLQYLVRRSLLEPVREDAGASAQATEQLAARTFSTWWRTAVAYSALLVTFDVLISATGILKDRGFYAACLGAGANLYIIVYSSLHKRGREVRGQVLRSVVTLAVMERPARNHTRAVARSKADATTLRAVSRAPLMAILASNALVTLPFSALLAPSRTASVWWLGIASAVLGAAAVASTWAACSRTTKFSGQPTLMLGVGLSGAMWAAALATAALATTRTVATDALAVATLAASLTVGGSMMAVCALRIR